MLFIVNELSIKTIFDEDVTELSYTEHQAKRFPFIIFLAIILLHLEVHHTKSSIQLKCSDL